MSLKEFLDDFTTLRSRTAPDVSTSLLASEAAKIRERHGFVIIDTPGKTDIEAVYRKLYKFLYHPSPSLSLNRKELKLVPWAFMSPVDGNPPLYENEAFIRSLFKLLKHKSKFDVVRPFIQVFLQEYPQQSKQFELLRAELYDLVVGGYHTKVNTIKQWVISSHILDKQSHELCSQQLVDSGFQSTFSDYKLSKGLEYSGFAIASLSHYLKRLESDLSAHNKDLQSEIVSACIGFFIEHDESFKYPSLRINIAEGLLASFTLHQATPVIKKILTDFFIHQYGDPRTSRAQWHGVNSMALDVIKGWMVENTMNDFFNLLSHVAKTDPTADKHWKYRKRFWNAYLRNGHIQEAWVALGTRAYGEANNFLQGGRNTYAKLSGAQPRHSALIMVINGVLITEWSHVGSYRLWDTSNKRPKLYLKQYHRGSLVDWADHTGSHTGSENGRWQQKLSHLIDSLTGVSVSNREYMYD
ncbi:EH signature domain-containing protein [Vibrio sp. Vb1554]|uniref:EH signature domain-containing protein n=1 Tax=Vibrio sp. Vb1554 TaxID=3074642 RepID=UPI002965D9FF|nr:EH signature domain-containing protein [Vibrio sp. Vb1554]MDW3048243.1 EH signature domain-containing protein [Vibrio sp. Vb1554]